MPIMGKSDWEKIMQIAETVTYVSGEVIIEQGSSKKDIYHCVKGLCLSLRGIKFPGQCKVMKQKSNDEITELARINPHEIFGELNYLEEVGTKTYASVVADSDIVEACRIYFDSNQG